MTCLHPLKIDMKKHSPFSPWLERYIEVPCGKCIKCIISKEEELIFRAYCQFLSAEQKGCFFALTYDDEHRPYRVSKKHAKYFIDHFKVWYQKNVGELPKNFGYLVTSEYGDEHFREHYHVCLFGIDFYSLIQRTDFKKLSPVNKYGGYDRIISPIWKKGHLSANPLDIKCIRYALKYTTKGRTRMVRNGERLSITYNQFLEDCGLEPLFTFYSRGLGSSYFIEHLEKLQKEGGITVNGKFHTLPPYWRDKLDINPYVFGTIPYKQMKEKQFKAKNEREKITRSTILYEQIIEEQKIQKEKML